MEIRENGKIEINLNEQVIHRKKNVKVKVSISSYIYQDLLLSSFKYFHVKKSEWCILKFYSAIYLPQA